jgi:hypothetical protein
MRPDTRAWRDGLREFAVGHRATRKHADAPEPTAFVAERGILGAHLAMRLADVETFRAARATGAAAGQADPDPVIVLTTSEPGMEAAAELFEGAAGGPFAALEPWIVPVSELEYRLWCIRTPDPGYRLHINLWNWVKRRVPRQRHAEFARHPLGPNEAYWLHRTGIAGAKAADRRECHLWKWNGRHASLLEAFVTEDRALSHRFRG